MHIRTLIAALAAVLVLGVAACGGSPSKAGSASKAVNPNATETSPAGDIPDNQAYVAYSPPGGGYSVKVPEGWSRTVKGGAVTFTDKLNSITMQSRAAQGSPQGATVKRHAGAAVRTTFLTPGKPDPVTGKAATLAVERYVFTHHGKAVVLTLSGAKGADNVDPWRIVTDSLRFTR
jgi:hypothetical protein